MVAGLTFVFNEVAQRDVAPEVVAFSRVALATVVLVGVSAAMGFPLARPTPQVAIVAAVQVAGPFLLLGLGQTALGVGDAAIVLATVPLLTAALAPYLYPPERSAAGPTLALAVGFAGVILAVSGDVGALGSTATWLGLGAVALSALGFAAGGLLAQRLPAAPPIAVATAVMALATVELLPLAAVTAPSSRYPVDALLAMLALGVVGTGGVFFGLYVLIRRFGATTAALLDYGAPACGLVYGALLFNEGIGALRSVGVGLVVFGSAFALVRSAT